MKRGIFWPVLIIGVGSVMLLQALAVFPPVIGDLVNRAWPVVLVLIGLGGLLDQIPRLRGVAPLIALAGASLLLVGIVVTAYGSRAGEARTENTVTAAYELEDNVTLLHVVVTGRASDVEISPAVDRAPSIHAEFTGSMESELTPAYTVGDDGVATFAFEEVTSGGLPLLENVGRGQMRIELPPGLPVELDFRTDSGTVSLNLLGLDVQRMNVAMGSGDLLLSLPENGLNRAGDVVLPGGNVTVFVPDDLGLQFSTTGGTPQFAEGTYLYDPSADVWVARQYDSFTEQTTLNLTVGGSLRLE